MDAIGIIAGSGRLPFVAAAEARAQGRRVVVVGLEGVTDPALGAAVDAMTWVHLGQVGALVRALRDEGVVDVLLLGKVEITNLFSQVRPDLLGAKLLLKARDLRGDTLLEALIGGLVAEGLHVRETPPFLGPLCIRPGQLSRRSPGARERQDLRLGWEVARQIASLRIGQTVVIKHGVVLAVESVEGTDAAVRRGGALGRGGVVVVKVGRPDQDLRFDLPTIGPETLPALQEAGATALGLDAAHILLLERETFLREAERLDLAVVAE
jgi:UDP-2,3-diacylglucosamine hydrolase